MPVFYIAFGAVFGFVLSRSGATDYDVIQEMFLFTNFQLYGIMGAAVVIAAPAFWYLKRIGMEVPKRPLHRGNVYGGILFGVGWSMTGMCPAPILVNIGEGKIYALAALAGALVGTGLFAQVQPRLMRARPLGTLRSSEKED